MRGLMAIATLLVVGAGAAVPAAAQTKIVMGWCSRTISSATTPFAIATKMGWYKAEGIEVELVPLPGSGDCVKNVATREVLAALPSASAPSSLSTHPTRRVPSEARCPRTTAVGPGVTAAASDVPFVPETMRAFRATCGRTRARAVATASGTVSGAAPEPQPDARKTSASGNESANARRSAAVRKVVAPLKSGPGGTPG